MAIFINHLVELKFKDNPKVLSQILESIDTISPSIYEEYGHSVWFRWKTKLYCN